MFGWFGVVVALIFMIGIPAVLLGGFIKAARPGNRYGVTCLTIASVLFAIFLFNEGPGELFVAIIPLSALGIISGMKD